MKTLLSLAVAALTSTSLHAQHLTPAQVPAPVSTAFAQAFPKAMDVEWKQKGEQYKVEFETGLLFTDHEVWYDATGKMLRHEEEISSSDLPAAVNSAIAKEFAGYRVDDTERVTADGVATYVVELKMSGQPEWKVAYGADGKQLQKQAD
ncbi:MAG TPA: PepSY-like domain-containing protein [Flavobacteriales bacterium]|jgi:uncharacterized membrane protein YkoI|nr:PepSY-like domain-containing protein [Flavobacteriales bacterium]HMU13827.1 PepSY-like domain-containing protein [Flavobacteriales bacterium]HMZ50258.1 PepSY-like domain-containing protein [Flavobacteriales bacterium]HNA32615.1 PepSY-like domain-containing protein [Flavobacteriales bacterium]HNE81225.1 PepSY-like domain-containing protein [Flavobacteriales bacterium]